MEKYHIPAPLPEGSSRVREGEGVGENLFQSPQKSPKEVHLQKNTSGKEHFFFVIPAKAGIQIPGQAWNDRSDFLPLLSRTYL